MQWRHRLLRPQLASYTTLRQDTHTLEKSWLLEYIKTKHCTGGILFKSLMCYIIIILTCCILLFLHWGDITLDVLVLNPNSNDRTVNGWWPQGFNHIRPGGVGWDHQPFSKHCSETIYYGTVVHLNRLLSEYWLTYVNIWCFCGQLWVLIGCAHTGRWLIITPFLNKTTTRPICLLQKEASSCVELRIKK